jgi:hypothetical protein
LLLLGDGRGDFKPSSPQDAGISILGQQSTPAHADFANTGKVDALIGQNSAATQLLRNRSGSTGVRVLLRGPAGNRDAIGAQLRPVVDGRAGATREIQCASGPIGQSSFAQVFAGPTRPTAVRVMWPGGKVAEYPLPAPATSATIDFEKGVPPSQ